MSTIGSPMTEHNEVPLRIPEMFGDVIAGRARITEINPNGVANLEFTFDDDEVGKAASKLIHGVSVKGMSISANGMGHIEAVTIKEPTIHDEPDCTNSEGLTPNGCLYPEPHKHGFACDNTCQECEKDCHPHCPAFDLDEWKAS